LAIALGVQANLSPIWFEALAVTGMSSPTGRCHTFDECADGMVRGEGCGAIILQRVSDAISSSQKMYGIVQSANVAQDGISASLTAPNGKSQEKLLISSLQEAGISGEDVDYIEAHGTGTSLGDPIEIGALISAIGERKKNHPVVVGSVKANIGHLETASGIAGIINAILVLQNEKAPPNAGLKKLNSKIEQIIGDTQFIFQQNLKIFERYQENQKGID
jgi:acyl transferase domain-containing protein